jgi:hypothetical protein
MSVDCPGCQQRNDDGMLFCIFCGAALKQQAPPGLVTPPGPTPVICPSCGQADTLNSQFCIFCGANTGQRYQPPVPNKLSSLGHIQNELGDVRSDLNRSVTVARRGLPLVPLFAIAGIVAGLALGGGIAYVMGGTAPGSAGPDLSKIPASSIVVYSKQPNADVTVEWPDHRYYAAGRTSANGSLMIPNTDPGKYFLTVANSGSSPEKVTAIVKPGEPQILGYPDKL